jgi:hypothetical protein
MDDVIHGLWRQVANITELSRIGYNLRVQSSMMWDPLSASAGCIWQNTTLEILCVKPHSGQTCIIVKTHNVHANDVQKLENKSYLYFQWKNKCSAEERLSLLLTSSRVRRVSCRVLYTRPYTRPTTRIVSIGSNNRWVDRMGHGSACPAIIGEINCE